MERGTKAEKIFLLIIKKKRFPKKYFLLVFHPFQKQGYTDIYPSLENYLGGFLRHLLAVFMGIVLNANISQGLICTKILHQHSGYKDHIVEPLPLLVKCCSGQLTDHILGLQLRVNFRIPCSRTSCD